jgi:hypothetical protein
MVDPVRRIGRFGLIVFEVALLTALIVVTRCANYQDVLVAGNVYFVDADCYARMTRAQMVREKPGLIIRHHAFENFPQGTIPHTTAPLDYLIVALSLFLNPFTAHALDLAGAFVSPLLALLAGWFLWWWSVKFRYRWVLLILYATSPILVHGTELGRPDHQSLLILLVAIAICAEWSWQDVRASTSTDTEGRKETDEERWRPTGVHAPLKSNGDGGPSFADATAGKLEPAAPCLPSDAIRESRIPWRLPAWAVTSAVCWAVAIWVSMYEPLVLFMILTATAILMNRRAVFARDRRAGWILFAVIIAIAFAVEQRVPSLAILQSDGHLKSWASTIGELVHVSPMNPVWLNWCGYLLLITPILIWIGMRTPENAALSLRRAGSARALPIYVLLVATYFLTVWQARWGYFFVLIFALALPALLAPIKSAVAVWIALVLSMFPILRDWDERLWPNEAELAKRMEQRIESAQIHGVALSLRSPEVHPFLAPWWLSPSIAYWSAQPGVAGSSHESLNGIEDSARFFLSEDLQKAHEILEKRRVAWVFAYDSDRVAQNSAAILNEPPPLQPLCRVLDRTPSQAPPFFIFFAQNQTCKLYGVAAGR